MMKPYFIVRELEYDQLPEQLYPQVAITSPSAYTRTLFNRPIDKILPLEFKLEEKTILTDFISVNRSWLPGRGLLLSPDALNLIKEFSLPTELISIPAKVIFNSSVFDYMWVHPTAVYNHYIDFARTKFTKEDRLQNSVKEIIITGEEDLNKKRLNKKAYEAICIDKNLLFFKSSFDADLDLILLNISNKDFFISTRLKEALLSSGVTGFGIEDKPYTFSQ